MNNKLFLNSVILRVKSFAGILLMLSMFHHMGCSFSKKDHIQSTFEIGIIDSTIFINYVIIEVTSLSGLRYILAIDNNCTIETSELLSKYERIIIGEDYEMRLYEYKNYPSLESSLRSAPDFEYHISDNPGKEFDRTTLVWANGTFFKKIYRSPELCGLYIARR